MQLHWLDPPGHAAGTNAHYLKAVVTTWAVAGLAYVGQMTVPTPNQVTAYMGAFGVGVAGIVASWVTITWPAKRAQRLADAVAAAEAFKIKEEAEKGSTLRKLAEMESLLADEKRHAAEALARAADATAHASEAEAEASAARRLEAEKDARILDLEAKRDHITAEYLDDLKHRLQEKGHFELGPAAAGAAAEAVVKAITGTTPDPDAPRKGEARP